MDSPRHRALRRIVLLVDLALIALAMPTAAGLHALLRHHLSVLHDPPSFDQYAALPFLTIPLFATWIAGLGLHRLHARGWTTRQLLAGLLQLHAAVFLSLAVLIVATQSIVNRSLIALFLVCSFLLLLGERLALLAWQRYQHQRGPGQERLLVVGGDGEGFRSFLEEERASPLPPLVIGRLGADGDPPPDDAAANHGIPYLGRVSDLPRILHQNAVDHVLFFAPLHEPGALAEALARCEEVGVPASFEVPLPPPSTASPRLALRGRRPFVTFDVAPKSPLALGIKHALDVAAAALLLLLLAPLLLVVALLVWTTMGRPILFVQERAGLNGRRFRMLKFRTMVNDAERRKRELEARNEMSGPVFKLGDDPRVTPLGRLLRRSSVDELPQLFNVLTGQMSLIGPRPLPLAEQTAIVGWQRRRLSMKPGLTGLWQVSGRSGVDFAEWMRLDLQYIDRWSLSLDARILWRTIPAVLFGRGAR